MDGSGPSPHGRLREPLFRRDAIEAQRSQWLGTVLALPGLPATAIAVGSLVVAAALLGLLFFADFTRKARVTGWLAPADGLLRVVAPRPGTILRIHVREGDEVKQGEALLTLSTDVRNAAIGAVGEQIVSHLRQQIETLEASRGLDAALAEAQADALAQRAVMLDRESAATQREATVQRARLEIARRSALRQRALRDQGLQTEQRLERAEEEELEQAARVLALEQRHMALEREAAEARAERLALPLRRARQQADAERAIAVVKAELAQAEGARELVLPAPQTGTVTSLVTDAGDSVAALTPLLAILPEGAALQAQLFAPSSAVGFLRPGQVVRLRYAAYPYQRFGHHAGRIAEVSRAAMAPMELPPRLAGLKALQASGEPLYRITVTLATQSVGAYGTALPLQPGMQLEADIMVERRRLIEWAFDPLYTIAGRVALMSGLVGRLSFGFARRLPLVLQTEAAECGLASLAMVAGYHGHGVELSDLRRRFGLSLKGATLLDLTRIAGQLGLISRPLRLELQELRLLRTPCILHWDMSHFVVLRQVTGTSIVVHDSAVGERRLSLDAASRHFTGVALELTPAAEFAAAAPAPRVGMQALLGRMVGVKRALSQLLALALAIEVFAMLGPLFLAWVVDHALVSADRDLLTTLVLAFGLLLLVQTSISAMRGWLVMRLGAAMKVQARANLFTHLLRLPPTFFEARHTGDIMSRFGSQENILQAITTDLVLGLLDGLMCVVTLVVMLLIAPGLASLVLTGAALYALLRVVTYRALHQASAEAIIWSARRDTHFLETLRGIRTIKLFNGQEERRARWLNLLVETVNRQIATQRIDLLSRTANAFLLGAVALLVVWVAALQVLAGAFTVGLLFAFVAYKDLFMRRISDLTNRLVELRMLRLHTERLADVALAVPEAEAATGSTSPEVQHTAESHRSSVAVEARGISFRYGAADPPVLEDVSFRIEAGESVAISGPSGCGKTTLLKLLAGLLQPSAGELLVDGVPITQLGLARYRSMLGVVMQDDQLFAGSVGDNICFFASRPDRALMERCSAMAAVHDDIMAMPMGYESLIGDMGAALSGGQKQRVLIARALYRQPSVLLLDEATSHLDVAREHEVNAAVAAAAMTRIAVAHRPETIRAAGRVIRLEKGRVVTAGTAIHVMP